MAKVPEIFGSMVFNDQKMQERLPKSTYKALKKTIQNGEPLDLSVANVVAAAMKDWAVEMGCNLRKSIYQRSSRQRLPVQDR